MSAREYQIQFRQGHVTKTDMPHCRGLTIPDKWEVGYWITQGSSVYDLQDGSRVHNGYVVAAKFDTKAEAEAWVREQ